MKRRARFLSLNAQRNQTCIFQSKAYTSCAETDTDTSRPPRINVRCTGATPFVTISNRMSPSESTFDNLRRPRRTGELVTVGRVEDVPDGRGATVELDNGQELALYHIGGEFYAIDNFCPHKGAPLADGQLHGHSVTCDWHGWRFDVRSGACLNRASIPVESYEVRIEDGWIKIVI
ncbi:MAG TPA: non-heme iron oxygenase ferredoxin subunit [Pyrinomonadaceae bacterium]